MINDTGGERAARVDGASWRPIEGAPSGVGPLMFYEPPENLRHDGIVFIGYMEGDMPCDEAGRRMWPTHWMELPEPPSPTKPLAALVASSLTRDEHGDQVTRVEEGQPRRRAPAGSTASDDGVRDGNEHC